MLLSLGVTQTQLGRTLEAKALDFRFRWRGAKPPGAQVVLVAIDDQSIAELGRWPWSRQQFGAVVHRLQAAGARVIVFDVLFLEPEVNATRDVLQEVQTTRITATVITRSAASGVSAAVAYHGGGR